MSEFESEQANRDKTSSNLTQLMSQSNTVAERKKLNSPSCRPKTPPTPKRHVQKLPETSTVSAPNPFKEPNLVAMQLNPSEPSAPMSYEVWSNCLKTYLLGQDLWDVIEPDGDSETSNTKRWRRKNALALHAIHTSCGAATLPAIGKLESAKQAWDHLRSINTNIDPDRNSPHAKDVTVPMATIAEEQVADGIDYAPFKRATAQENLMAMKEFFVSHPGSNPAAVLFNNARTALHYVLYLGNIEIGEFLLDKLEQEKDLEILDGDGHTAFAYLSNYNEPGVKKLMERMVEKNKKLPNIGLHSHNIPVVMASWKGFKDTTHYLYGVTDEKILDPELGDKNLGAELLINCINMGWFDTASKIVTKFPNILQQHSGEEVYPIHALAKSFSALKNRRKHRKSRALRLNHWLSKSFKHVKHDVQRRLGWNIIASEGETSKLVYNKALAFLQLVCAQVKNFDVSELEKYVYAAMIEATKNGVAEFVTEMLIANPDLIEAGADKKPMFWHAVENRQENIYSLIYGFMGRKDNLLSCSNPESNNILHLAAKLAPSAVLDRTSGPALQLQRELQWFQEVWSLAKPRYREDLNNEDSQQLTPRALFTKSHAKLTDDGEKAMKDTAQSCTVVGALIITVMFAAAFTVPGGNNSDTGLPVFLRKILFRIFIVCDSLSLYSSTTSVLVFLGILTSRYAEEDFLLKLPRELMIGLTTLFFSITTMMISFCMALALMLQGQLQYMLPTVLLAVVPIVIFMSSIVPLLEEIFMSTFGPSIFDKTGKIQEIIEKRKLEAREGKKTSNDDKASADKKFASTKENNSSDPSSVDEIV